MRVAAKGTAAYRNMGGWHAVLAHSAALSSPASAQSARPSQRQAGGKQRVRAPVEQLSRAPHAVALPGSGEQCASSEPSPQSGSPSHHQSLQRQRIVNGYSATKWNRLFRFSSPSHERAGTWETDRKKERGSDRRIER